MRIFSKKETKNLLKFRNISPKKSLGQNFLTSKSVLNKILDAADIKSNDVVLEIGPGLGILTKELAKKVYPVKSAKGGAPLPAGQFNRAGKVITVEKDEKMCQILEENLKEFKNVEIICGDILKNLNFKFQILNSYKIVANLPYNIATAIIRKFLETENPPEKMVLMVQKEVGQRICAKAPHMNILAVSVQFYADTKILFYVSKESFSPKPKVDGAVIEIKPRIYPVKSSEAGAKQFNRVNTDKKQINADVFFKIVKAGFSQPRKQLANNFRKALKLDNKGVNSWLLKNNINPKARAENLTIEDWINLTKSVPLTL